MEQVSLALGHAGPAFTARVDVHLDADNMPDPAVLEAFGQEDTGPEPARPKSGSASLPFAFRRAYHW